MPHLLSASEHERLTEKDRESSTAEGQEPPESTTQQALAVTREGMAMQRSPAQIRRERAADPLLALLKGLSSERRGEQTQLNGTSDYLI